MFNHSLLVQYEGVGEHALLFIGVLWTMYVFTPLVTRGLAITILRLVQVT